MHACTRTHAHFFFAVLKQGRHTCVCFVETDIRVCLSHLLSVFFITHGTCDCVSHAHDCVSHAHMRKSNARVVDERKSHCVEVILSWCTHVWCTHAEAINTFLVHTCIGTYSVCCMAMILCVTKACVTFLPIRGICVLLSHICCVQHVVCTCCKRRMCCRRIYCFFSINSHGLAKSKYRNSCANSTGS